MRDVVLIAALVLALTGCDRAPPSAPPGDEANDAARAAGAQQANAMMAQTRQDALEARVATLENQMDTLKAEVDTHAALGAALTPPAVPALPPPPTPPAAPRLPYEPPVGGPSN